jgi:NADH:ubiquinone oxidoreductase subunit 6 (subunit J)
MQPIGLDKNTSLLVQFGPSLVPLAMGSAAIYLLLPRARPFWPWWGRIAAVLALVLAGWLLIWQHRLTAEGLLFYAFAAVALCSGGLLITQENPVHAALSFALVVVSTSGLFLLQAAPFLAAATVIVYAGAIVVIFLFVIMLAQQAGLSGADHRSREPLLACAGGLVLLAALVFLLQETYDNRPLAKLIKKARSAASLESVSSISEFLGNDNEFLAAFQHRVENADGAPEAASLESDLLDARASWPSWKKSGDATAMRKALQQLADKGSQVCDTLGTLQPHGVTEGLMSPYGSLSNPALAGENVAPLGQLLFTDYLIAVELAGMLLLTAMIGAIAISGRRAEGLR